MSEQTMEIRLRGRTVLVPCARVAGHPVVVTGRWLRLARVHDEDWIHDQAVVRPESFLAELQEAGLRADLFTFTQRLPAVTPQFPYRYEWDNLAVIPIGDYQDWWTNRLPQESRKNVRRSQRRGVEVRTVPLDDELIRGIVEIYNEMPFRQGKRFPHYGKDFQTIKQEVSTILDHSEFLAAYHQSQLIGFIKLVYMQGMASILHIVSLNAHADKRPTNALLARAVQACCDRGLSYLVYGKYAYGNKLDSPLTDFKRRNGFERINVPRYQVPLTWKGSLALRCGLHRGLIGLLPGAVVDFLVGARARMYEFAGQGRRPETVGSRAQEEPAETPRVDAKSEA